MKNTLSAASIVLPLLFALSTTACRTAAFSGGSKKGKGDKKAPPAPEIITGDKLIPVEKPTLNPPPKAPPPVVAPTPDEGKGPKGDPVVVDPPKTDTGKGNHPPPTTTPAVAECAISRPAYCQFSSLANPLQTIDSIVGANQRSGISATLKTLSNISFDNFSMDRSCITASVIVDSNWTNVNLRDDELILANMTRGHWLNSKWENVDARLSNLSASTFKDTQIIGSCLAQANLADSILEGHVSFAGSDLRNSNMGHMQIKGSVDWTGALLDGAVWIDGRKCAAGSVGVCK